MAGSSVLEALRVNDLGVPAIWVPPSFEDLLAENKAAMVAYVRESDPDLADDLAVILEDDAEIAAKLMQAITVLQRKSREEISHKAQQTYAIFAEGDALDAKVADLGLRRQVIDPGDPDAIPPVPQAMESDEDLLVRYLLAPHAFSSAGPDSAYRFHALTLGAAPRVTVTSPSENVVTVTYDMTADPPSVSFADAQVERLADATVRVTVLGRSGDGVVSQSDLDAALAYLTGDFVGVFTDDVEVAAAVPLPYQVDLVVRVYPGADTSVIQANVLDAVQSYVSRRRQLGEPILRSRLDQIAHGAGAVEVSILAPVSDVRPAKGEWAYNTAVSVSVEVLS